MIILVQLVLHYSLWIPIGLNNKQDLQKYLFDAYINHFFRNAESLKMTE